MIMSPNFSELLQYPYFFHAISKIYLKKNFWFRLSAWAVFQFYYFRLFFRRRQNFRPLPSAAAPPRIRSSDSV